MDINCDMGESFGIYRIGNDEEIIKYISSANIACGFHGGDPLVMEKTVHLAISNGVGVGAHPGFPDLLGFGRRNLQTFKGEIRAYILYQIGALDAFCRKNGAILQHIKPHGALYNMAAQNWEIALEIVDAVKSYNKDLILLTQAGSELHKVAKEEGLRIAKEVFPDRAYLESGRLAPRTMKGALIHDPTVVRERIKRLILEGRMKTIDDKLIAVEADTLCVHGDTPESLKIALAIREELEKNGVEVKPLGEVKTA